MLNSTIYAVRDLAYDLRPPGLEDLGLTQTIYLFCEELSEKRKHAVFMRELLKGVSDCAEAANFIVNIIPITSKVEIPEVNIINIQIDY